MLSLLYGTHFAISIILLQNISISSSSDTSINIACWLLFSFLIIPFIISYLTSMVIIIYDLYDIYNDNISQINPLLPFHLIYLIIIKQHNLVQHISINENNNGFNGAFTASNILFVNYIITMISWMIASLLGPIISIFGIFNNEVRHICIGYQLLYIIPTSIFHFCFINTFNYYSLILFCLSIVYIIIISMEYIHKFKQIVFISILTEMILMFFLVYITYLVDYNKYDENDKIIFFIALIGFINFCFPNAPFYKSYLLWQYVKWSDISHVFDFIVCKSDKDDFNEMMDKLYCYIHQISHTKHHDNHQLNQINLCFVQHSNYLKMTDKQKYQYIHYMVYNNNNNDNPQYKICENVLKFIYTMSWMIAYLYPIIWLSAYFGLNDKIFIYDIELFNYQQLFILILFMFYFALFGVLIGTLYHKIFNLKRFKMMRMCYYLSPNGYKHINHKYYGKLEIIYDNLIFIKCLINIFHHDIGCIILSYSLGNCHQPNYLDGPQLAFTYDL